MERQKEPTAQLSRDDSPERRVCKYCGTSVGYIYPYCFFDKTIHYHVLCVDMLINRIERLGLLNT